MKILGMGTPELIIILVVVVLLIFGPKNLPKLGSALGKTLSSLREGMSAGKKKDAENVTRAETIDPEPVKEPASEKTSIEASKEDSPKDAAVIVEEETV